MYIKPLIQSHVGKTLVPVTGHWEGMKDKEKKGCGRRRGRGGRGGVGDDGYLLLSTCTYSLLKINLVSLSHEGWSQEKVGTMYWDGMIISFLVETSIVTFIATCLHVCV